MCLPPERSYSEGGVSICSLHRLAQLSKSCTAGCSMVKSQTQHMCVPPAHPGVSSMTLRPTAPYLPATRPAVCPARAIQSALFQHASSKTQMRQELPGPFCRSCILKLFSFSLILLMQMSRRLDCIKKKKLLQSMDVL